MRFLARLAWSIYWACICDSLPALAFGIAIITVFRQHSWLTIFLFFIDCNWYSHISKFLNSHLTRKFLIVRIQKILINWVDYMLMRDFQYLLKWFWVPRWLGRMDGPDSNGKRYHLEKEELNRLVLSECHALRELK